MHHAHKMHSSSNKDIFSIASLLLVLYRSSGLYYAIHILLNKPCFIDN